MREGDPELHTVPPNPSLEVPRWRQDFPIDWPQDHYVARRDFTKFLCLTSLAFAVGQFFIAFQNWRRRRRGEPPIMKIAERSQLPVSGAVVFHYPNEAEPCLLLRTEANTLVAYSQKCTHLACAVVPDKEPGQLLCPCHHGYFETSTGRPIAGPPRRPLPRIVDGCPLQCALHVFYNQQRAVDKHIRLHDYGVKKQIGLPAGTTAETFVDSLTSEYDVETASSTRYV